MLVSVYMRSICDTLTANDDDYASTKQKLAAFFSTKKNVQYQVLTLTLLFDHGRTLELLEIQTSDIAASVNALVKRAADGLINVPLLPLNAEKVEVNIPLW